MRKHKRYLWKSPGKNSLLTYQVMVKKGGSLELFLTHHTATPGTADVSQNTAKCAWDIWMYTVSLEKKNCQTNTCRQICT